jgi:hypothetical protein
MTLTIALVLSVLLTGVLAYGAWRLPTRLPRIATLMAVGTPLLLLVAVMRGRSDAPSRYSHRRRPRRGRSHSGASRRSRRKRAGVGLLPA